LYLFAQCKEGLYVLLFNVLGHYDLMLVSVSLGVLIDYLCSAQRERQLITEPGVLRVFGLLAQSVKFAAFTVHPFCLTQPYLF